MTSDGSYVGQVKIIIQHPGAPLPPLPLPPQPPPQPGTVADCPPQPGG